VKGSLVSHNQNAMSQRPVQSRFFRAVGNAACLLAVLAMLGGHWVALQSIAWARMIGQYAREGSLGSAISKTFDGRHPCPLCLIVEQGRQQEERDQKNLPWVKLGKAFDLLCDLRPTPVPPPPLAATPAVPFVPGQLPDWLESPPTPPPRAA